MNSKTSYINKIKNTNRSRTSRRWWTTGIDWIDILYLPYTLMFVCYYIIGCMLAPTQQWLYIIISTICMFLAVGICAHCFDEIKGRPLGTSIKTKHLKIAGISTLVLIGIVSLFFTIFYHWTVFFVFIFCSLALIFYNLELLEGRFHNDMFFTIAFASIPLGAGYYLSALAMPPLSISIFIIGFSATAAVETVINHFIKEYSNYQNEYSNKFAYLQRAIWAILWCVYLTAIGLVVYRLGA